ncbi:thioesterase family protein [Streptococcus uberis]|nr:thioesterase family protein [Streptococcus uberis]MCK1198074.1 thioesterase family protein [Streptococcus uberis]MCK1244481.1 thioesterase family protein [Streptococcus uberis]
MTIFSKIFDTEEKHSASQMGSGGLSVLSTPSLVAFMENAAYHLAETLLQDPTQSTVGSHICIQHLKASKIGDPVTINITDLKVNGRRFDFRIEAFVKDTFVAEASHTRIAIDCEKFLKNL